MGYNVEQELLHIRMFDRPEGEHSKRNARTIAHYKHMLKRDARRASKLVIKTELRQMEKDIEAEIKEMKAMEMEIWGMDYLDEFELPQLPQLTLPEPINYDLDDYFEDF
jgi:hypothetical protein